MAFLGFSKQLPTSKWLRLMEFSFSLAIETRIWCAKHQMGKPSPPKSRAILGRKGCQGQAGRVIKLTSEGIYHHGFVYKTTFLFKKYITALILLELCPV